MNDFFNSQKYIEKVKDVFLFPRKNVSVILTIVFLILFALLQLRLVSNTFYVDTDNNIHSTTEGYGDIPLHLTQISKFAFSDNFNLNEPIYYGNSLQYPFITNLIRGLFLRFSGAWTASVLWPVYILVIANIVLLFLIYKRFLKNNALTIVAFLIFFLGSGLNAWNSLKFDAVFPDQNIDFRAPISLVFIHQQTFFLGFLFFLLFIWLLFLIKENPQRKYFIIAGIVFGCLPLIHTHSFVAATAVLFFSLILSLKKGYKHYLKGLLLTFSIGVVLSLPQLYFLLSAKNTLSVAADFARFRLGWMMETGIGAIQFPTDQRSVFSLAFLDFLWVNLGIILPLFIICFIIAIIYRKYFNGEDKSNILIFGLSGLSIFTVVQLIKFQPWDFDNNKLLVYFLFFTASFIIWLLSYILRNHKYIKGVVITGVLILSTYSCVVEVTPRLLIAKKDLPIVFSNDAQLMAEYIRLNTDENNMILTSTTHRNPVSSLAGRQVVVGYPGWLWTRGINYSARENEVMSFYRSPNLNSTLFEEFPISYILIDDTAVKDYKADVATFDHIFTKVFEAGDYILYSIPKPLN
ncbi:MAG: hypothetical protein WC666_03395 [Candidatus Paceibacterota bacterium]|jgi:hypothetical protein